MTNKKWKKGSFTVEGTFLMPLFIGLLVFIIYMGFYYYNQGVCIYACYMVGNSAANEQEAMSDYQSFLSNLAIAMNNPKMNVEKKDDEILVLVSGSQYMPFVNRTVAIDSKERYVRLNQRGFILKCKFFQSVLE